MADKPPRSPGDKSEKWIQATHPTTQPRSRSRSTRTIGLIRHGITEWNSLGKAQAIATAKRVYSEQWDFIYSSDLIRALQTAEVISNALGITSVTTDYRLREIYCGQIEGTTEEERIMKLGTEWRLKSLGMEPFEEVAKRGREYRDVI